MKQASAPSCRIRRVANQSRPCNGMDLSSGAPLPSGSQPPHHTATKPGSLCNKVNSSFSRRSLQQSSLLFEWLVFPLRAIMHITQDTFIRRKECFPIWAIMPFTHGAVHQVINSMCDRSVGRLASFSHEPWAMFRSTGVSSDVLDTAGTSSEILRLYLPAIPIVARRKRALKQNKPQALKTLALVKGCPSVRRVRRGPRRMRRTRGAGP